MFISVPSSETDGRCSRRPDQSQRNATSGQCLHQEYRHGAAVGGLLRKTCARLKYQRFRQWQVTDGSGKILGGLMGPTSAIEHEARQGMGNAGRQWRREGDRLQQAAATQHPGGLGGISLKARRSVGGAHQLARCRLADRRRLRAATRRQWFQGHRRAVSAWPHEVPACCSHGIVTTETCTSLESLVCTVKTPQIT